MHIVIRTDATNYGNTIPMVRTFTVFSGTYAQCAAYIRNAAYTMRQKCENEGSLISACSPRSNRSALREVVHYGGSLKNKIQTRWDVATSHMVCKEEELDGFSINNVHEYVYIIDGESHLKLEIFSSKKDAEKFLRKNKNFQIVEADLTLLDCLKGDWDFVPVTFKYNFKNKNIEILPGDSSAFEDGIFPSIKFHK